MADNVGTATEGMLDRLVEQFASPYDFLRELVQNAMDAGSDRVDVELSVHRSEVDDEVVFEIVVADAGHGMDEATIDDELTLLFASSKRLDRTMAGGFGVGFVSVFSWAPARVLVHTGARGGAWEIEFDAQRRFTRRALATPFEGTTVRCFRVGHASEADAVAEHVRTSLWRWCRFCPVELGFSYDGQTERIHEEPPPDDAALSIAYAAGDTTVRVAFAQPARVVLLRHGLVLAEAVPPALLPRGLASSSTHLQVWADSAAHSTDIGRDHVVHDAGRRLIEARIVDLVHKLRLQLADAVEALAGASTWSRARHERYGQLHAHLALEREQIARLDRRPLLRTADGGAVSVRTLADQALWSVVARIEPEPDGPASSVQGVPTVVATDDDARTWLDPWLATRGMISAPAAELLRTARPLAQPDPFVATISDLARRAGMASIVRTGELDGGWGFEVLGGVVLPPAHADRRVVLWLDERNPLFVAARACGSPAALLLAMAAEMGADVERVVEVLEQEDL